MSPSDKASIIKSLMAANVFLNKEAMDAIPESITYEKFEKSIICKLPKNEFPLSMGKEQLIGLFSESEVLPDENKVILGKSQEQNGISSENQTNDNLSSLKIIQSYAKDSKKREVRHFVSYFKARYEAIRKLLQGRVEFQDAISIRRLSPGQKSSIIGIVIDKGETKNGNITLTLEDTTGTAKAIIRKANPEAYKIAKEITFDEVIGITGSFTGEVFFANNVVMPDIPGLPYKKSPEEEYAAFTSDLHIGSKMFLPEEFTKFITWLNGETGSDDQKKIAKSIKYLFIVGDLVDGIGIYPGQENELSIKDVTEQYNECARYLAMMRKDLQIIVCAGNHDTARIAEPQPQIDRRYAKALYELPNVTVLSNPSFVNIASSKNFPGFDVLLYHGYCFDYYIAHVESLRNSGGYNRADLIMKYLLQKRHLAPTHASTLYIPDDVEDPLVIDKVPDFFATGHIHKVSVSNYKNITMICGSCWQDKTTFQEKVGHNPEPGRVPIVNLKTREVKIMRFDR